MEITLVKVFPVQEEKLKAFVSVVFDNCFMVNDIKVIQGKDGLFLSMPSRRKKSGEFKDVAHPLNNATRRLLEERVLSEYRQVVEDPTPRRPDRSVEATPSAIRPSAPPAAARAPVREEEESAEVMVPPAAASPVTQPSAPAMVAADGDGRSGEKTLEEVQEIHLSDSFWSVS
jgi:stage V sporulation protein G